ncbi:MAG: type IV toxin-antitoxin system AbiEi family antitoxin domain-containing protein [Planctomycetes bacterium]|nr:type IV toxin-antitoxin system AbiEi family antitoxin domain-containing protein [Planctomycetota bacterium]
MSTDPSQSSIARVRSVFRGGPRVLRTSEILHAGIHPRTLYALREAGVLESLGRGLFRLADAPPLAYPDLVTVSAKIPQGVICLISALAHYELTTQVAHEVHVAIRRGSEPPRLDYPPIKLYWFGGEAYEQGVERIKADGFAVRMYSPEKTLADCFKYRHKIGLDTAVEALRRYCERRRPRVDLVLRYAEVCRVKNVMRPYLEALT